MSHLSIDELIAGNNVPDEWKGWIESSTRSFADLVDTGCHSVSIYETKPLESDEADDVILVSRENGVLQVADEVILASNANHFQITKFASATDPGYIQVCSQLKVIFGDLLSQDASFRLNVFPLTRVSPFGVDVNRDKLHNGTKSLDDNRWNELGDLWAHFPANNTAWIPVCDIVATFLRR